MYFFLDHTLLELLRNYYFLWNVSEMFELLKADIFLGMFQLLGEKNHPQKYLWTRFCGQKKEKRQKTRKRPSLK